MAKVTLRDALKNAQVSDKVVVTGDIQYCYYMTHICEGEALAKKTAREKANSSHPEYVPTYGKDEGALFFELNNALIQKQGDKPSELEIGFASKIFKRKDGSKALSFERKAPKNKKGEFFVPYIFGYKADDGKIHKINLTNKSLEDNQHVTLTYEVFDSRMGKGLGLRTVVFDQKPTFFKPASSTPEGWVDDDADDSAEDTDAVADEAMNAPEPAAEDEVGDDVFSD